MASTYTSNSGVEKPGIGDQSGEWGTTVNTNMDILDRAINGVGVITLSGTTHTLTTTDGALSDGQYKVLVLSGSPSGTNTITISPNDQDKLYFVVNSSGQTATFSQGSGANVSVVNGDTKIIYADGAGSGAAITEFASEVDALEGITAGTVAASKAVIVDANKDITGFRNVTLTGELDAGSLDVSGNADIDGTLEADAMTLDGTAITTTATLSTGISNGNVPVFTSGVADDDFLRVAGTAIEGRSAAEVLSDIGASPVAGSGSIVTTGALNSGSITSGFGSIDNGSSAITTTGVITGGTVEATTDTAAGDNAAIGYTSAEGLILTGQGSTSDFTVKNDADATVLSIPTGTTNVGIGLTNPTGKFAVSDGTVNYELNPAGSVGYMGTRSNHDVAIQINANEKLRVNTSGNVGIGTSAPKNRLQSTGAGVLNAPSLGSAPANAPLYLTNNDASYGLVVGSHSSDGHVWFQAQRTDGTATAYNITLNEAGGNVGIGTTAPGAQLEIDGGGSTATYLMTNDATAAAGGGGLNLSIDNSLDGYLNNAKAGALKFGTSNVERMRILSGGDVLINATAAINSEKFFVKQAAAANAVGIQTTGSDYSNMITFYAANNSVKGTIGATPTAVAYNTSSDYRLKENVDYSWDATTRLKQLKPARFNFISDASNTLVDGFLAHEVSGIVPEAISGTKDAVDSNGDAIYQGIDQSKLVPLLVKTIQELEARITALEAG